VTAHPHCTSSFLSRRWKLAAGLWCVMLPGCLLAPAAATTEAVPFSSGERLVYEITWPSGLSLGEVEFRANSVTNGWEFHARINATLPNLEIHDEYRSRTDAALCSFELEKDAVHGGKRVQETVEFDQQNHTASRKTKNGGDSEFDVPPCAKDGLTFLYMLRSEIGRGRIPPPDDLNFGAQYQVTMTYAETRDLEVAGEMVKVDRILVDLTGPASQRSFEIFFRQDPARTPVLIRVPFELGTFSLKLVK
jgi:Protein of unknown function (DUF3108)